MNNEQEKDHLVMCPKCETPVLIDGSNLPCCNCGLEIKDFDKYDKEE